MTPTVAVLGQGSIGRRHAALLADLGCGIRAWDPAGAVLDHPAVEAAAGAEEALLGADAAVVASPTSEHLSQARLALEHGCHVLVEKPISTSADGVAELVAEAESRGLLLAVAMNLRFHPGPAAVREAIASGVVGRPLVAHFTCGSYLPDWRPQADYREGYSARRALGGGVLLDIVHELDFAAWALGPAREVNAWLGRVSDLELDVEDVALLQVLHAGGVPGTIELDYLDRSYRRGARVVGSEASVDWSWPRATVEILRPGAEPEVRPAPADAAPTYGRQAEAFVQAVSAGGSAAGTGLVTGAEALPTMALVDAARESSRSGRRVALTAPSATPAGSP